MAEVLIDYDIQLVGADGRTYGARACGRERADRLWEGWIEFQPAGGGDTLRSGRETTQPKRSDLFYWATGLTAAYLDGALLRTLRQLPAVRPRTNPRIRPTFEGPAENPHSDQPVGYAPSAVLDPFRVYASGANLLRGQLNALSKDQLENIVKAYRLADESPAPLTRGELVALIMKAVEAASAR